MKPNRRSAFERPRALSPAAAWHLMADLPEPHRDGPTLFDRYLDFLMGEGFTAKERRVALGADPDSAARRRERNWLFVALAVPLAILVLSLVSCSGPAGRPLDAESGRIEAEGADAGQASSRSRVFLEGTAEA